MEKSVFLVKNLKILFWITIFFNSFLLFLVEPMFNRMILPTAGSSMSIWNIAIMCFQILLLGGYMYTNYLPKILGYKAYIWVHLGLLISSAIFSIAYFQMKNFTVNTSSPSLDIVLILLATIGIPYFVVSTSATNFQRWYNLTYKESPYHLYSLSNTGNLVALIGYGLVVEVLLGLRNQILLWNIIYSIMVAIGVFIGIKVYNKLKEDNFEEVKELRYKDKQEKIGFKRKRYWLLLSFIPCSLMIATNTVLDARVNVNSIHYFWILPLAVYLIAYIIAFSKLKLFDISVYEKIAFWLLIIILGILFMPFSNVIYVVSMVALFMVSLICNLYLVKDVPSASNLTEFYLYIALGGALGGVFASIFAPLVFNNVYEYPILVVIFLFTIFFKYRNDKTKQFKIEKWEVSIVFLLGFGIVILNGISIKSIYLLVILFILIEFRRLFSSPKTRLLSLVTLVFFTSFIGFVLLKNIDYQVRNFYGIKTVIQNDYIDESGNKHQLKNLIVGNTLHGTQFAKGSKYEFEALTYYDRTGSTIGRFLTTNIDRVKTIGGVGLGIGILTGLSTEGQEWKYFEIDPQILEIAKNSLYFTMMKKFKPEVVIGDARITLKSEKDKYYDVLVLDAYSGDIIPASLLTKEAVELYKSKLKDDGIIFFHISNNQFDLKPVLSTVAEAMGIDCYVDTSKLKGSVVAVDSEWVMLTNNKDLVAKSWKKIEKYPKFKIWTDDKYSLSTVLKK